MQPVRSPFPILRASLLIVALAAISILLARSDNPAAASSFDPHFSVSISDNTPGANADLVINFSLDAPDAFPNVKTKSTTQFIPRQWEVTPAPVGAIGGSFNALSTLGILGIAACSFPVPVPFTMIDATTDTSNLASALDLGGDLHPGGPGYSGQFLDDPATTQVPGDLGRPLIAFNANEKKNGGIPYRDVDLSGTITPGDIRFAQRGVPVFGTVLLPGTVEAGDDDVGGSLSAYAANEKHSENVTVNGQMDIGEDVYRDKDNSGIVTYGDIRLLPFAQLPANSVVKDFAIIAGVSRYPDYLNEFFPPEIVGEPLARQWGGQQVLLSAISLNILTFRPGQLPGYPATLGYPNVVILMNPVAPIDFAMINVTSDLCAPLSLTSTNLGISKDNGSTLDDESGYVRLTNPNSSKSHDFTLLTTSQPDADNDGIENMLDTCALTPNVNDLDGRNNGEEPFGGAADPDDDGLDSACDPDPVNGSGSPPFLGTPDEDMDFFANRADNCPTVDNGIDVIGGDWITSGAFTIFVAEYGGLIGPDNQADADKDDIGDACDPNPTVVDGHSHTAVLTQTIDIFKHGVKLNALGGPKTVNDGGARTYSVDVSNLADSSEDIQVALRVAEGCASVNGSAGQNTAVVSVGPGGSGGASFTVDFTGCAAGEYTVQADACHAGDAAPAGFFGAGACPGTSDGFTDPNSLDDAPKSKTVTAGSP